MPKPDDIRYFVDADRRRPNAALVGEQAEELAQSIAATPASQIRRFYGDVLAIGRRSGISDEAICTQMALLKAKAAYASGRKQIPRELLKFFVSHAAAVTDRTSYEAFRRVFEAVIAYHKFYETKRPGN
ncbi:type III-A CRISPR-associated protein Csm2 [Vineibacter terrae]|nr:type III-A CRISPR-associated protein Csm2 [Vineibacter terrae]